MLLVGGVGAVGFPVNIGEARVLLVNVSTPFRVDKVPDSGNIILLLPVVVSMRSPTPPSVKLPFRVMVLLTLATPVPPFAPGNMDVKPLAESACIDFAESSA